MKIIIFLLILIVSILIGYFQIEFEDLSGSKMVDMPSQKDLNSLERLRYSEEEYSFGRSQPLPEVIFDEKDPNFIQNLILKQKPVVIRVKKKYIQ